MPECYEDDSANERSNNGNTLDVDITDTRDYDDLSHQPDADDCCNNCADEAERNSPTNDNFSDNADNGRNYQVNDKAEADSPDVITNLNGDTVCNDCT